MGFFDKFKRKEQKNQQTQRPQSQQSKLPFDVQFSMTQDGRLLVDFYDKHAEFKQFYDTTRLVANLKPFDLGGRSVHNCLVSWYGKGDAIYFDNNGAPFGRYSDYTDILAEIDLDLLRSDPYYCCMVMKDLLSKQRVEGYINRGLQENPKMPCGKYIGGVMKTSENEYKKFFSVETGEASHNSVFMKVRRQKAREAEEKIRQKTIDYKEAQIKRLQEELDGMR